MMTGPSKRQEFAMIADKPARRGVDLYLGHFWLPKRLKEPFAIARVRLNVTTNGALLAMALDEFFERHRISAPNDRETPPLTAK
jgi:hypothetical protein